MFIYHFNRLIHSRILWGFFAILIAFAFVAVDSCFKTSGGEQSVGTINGKKVSSTQFEQIVQAVRGFGRNRDNATSASVVDRRVWEQIAARLTAEKNGMAATREEIRNSLSEVPSFQGPNGFDINRYRMILAEQGLTPAQYEVLVAHQLALMKDSAIVESAAWVTPLELDDELAAMTDRFTVQAATVSNRFATVDMRLSDENLRKFYEENQASFALSDRVSVRYIAVPVTNYLPFISVPEDDVQEYYDSHADTYTRAGTNNTTETIAFAEVREKILADLQLDEARYCASTSITYNIYGKLANAGSNALAVAAGQLGIALKTSPLFAANDTLYWAEKPKDFASAAFELDPERADSRFGIVEGDTLIYVIERADFSEAHTPTYEAVFNDLLPRAQAKARTDAFQDYVKELRADIRKLMDDGKNFSDAAQAKSLNVSTSLTYTVNEIQSQSFPNNFSIAYGAMTLKKGDLSEAVPASAAQSLLIYVQDRQPGDALAAEMLRSQLRSNIARRRNHNLFESWLTWNLAKQDFKPTRPLTSGDESDESAIGTADKSE
ncbi:MAG: SurA N-terminal domain-containing protein [Verrucomicrobiota bacterium]|nr:SurA N-terminal domain-containing protein [Verrucomicrobiota bacterium]